MTSSMEKMTAGLGGGCVTQPQRDPFDRHRRVVDFSRRNRRFGAALLGLVGYVALSLGGTNPASSAPVADVYAQYATKSKEFKSSKKPATGGLLHRFLCSTGDPSDAIAKDSGLGLFSGGAVFSLGRRFLTCETYAGTSEDLTYAADSGASESGTADTGSGSAGTTGAGADQPGGVDGTAENENNVAYVVTLAACPEDTTQPALLRDSDPADAFYDTMAVQQHGVCQCSADNPDSASTYNKTLYAIVHPDAVNCLAPETSSARRLAGDGATYYNRVEMLQDLGFWVKIYDNPLEDADIPAENSYLKANVESDVGLRDLMKLHAYRLTGHAVAVVMSFDAVVRSPMDSIFDAFKADAAKGALYSVDATTSGLDEDILVIKPDEAEYEAIKTAYTSTTYDASGGWGGGGNYAGSMGTKGFLKYYYESVKGAGAAEQTDLKTTGTVGAFDATCGKPYDCKYDDAWDAATIASCKTQNSEWFAYRYDFEQNWNRPTNTDLATSSYHRESFLGYCTADASEGGYTGITQTAPAPTPSPVTLAPTASPVTPAPVTPAPVPAPTPATAYDPCTQEDTSKFNFCLDMAKTGAYSAGVADWTVDVSAGAARWETVLVGDLPGTFNLANLNADYNCGDAPSAVDDLYICAKDPYIDGPYGVLGSAGPVLASSVTTPLGQKYMPIAGRMQFDSADIEMMLTSGIWGEVVTHEMGHILGVGTLWNQPSWGHDLVQNAAVPYYYKNSDSNACVQWREITGNAKGGANECPPIEEDGGGGTAGGHWDETVMPTELMSGYAGDGTSKLSAITVGCMQDLGYTVDYSNADAYTAGDIVSRRRRLQQEDDGSNAAHQQEQKTRSGTVRARALAAVDPTSGEWRRLANDDGAPRKRKLSQAGATAAVNYADAVLDKATADKHEEEEKLKEDNPNSDIIFIGNHGLSVYYMEGGTVYTVDVARDATGTP